MPVRLSILISIIVIVSCNSSENRYSNSQDKNDSMGAAKTKLSERINGPSGSLNVDDGGNGDIPVVFLHSFGGSTTNWKNQLDELRKSRRAIAIDLRGHGKSDIPADNEYSPDALASDVEAVVDSLKLAKFILVGHSMGGSAAIAYAGMYPNRVAGLVMVGAPGKIPAEMSKPVITSLEGDNYQKVMDDYMTKLFFDARPATKKEITDEMNRNSKEKNLSIIKSEFQYDPLPHLKNYGGPKLIIMTSAEENPNSLSKQNPSVPTKIMGGTSHWVQMDKPQDFNQILIEFINRVENNASKK